ncbi:MAG: flagellar biosynthesis regulator FlaF [Pseudomonadota bacterium]|nr:flagellar biosynthesis regulator FlaF [Pseudomonadota bacterium]
MPANPLDAYRSVEKATLSQRDLEATVLTKAALQLQSLRDNWTRENHDAQLEDALSYNQRVWSFFQAELSVDENPLPEEIRRNLLALSFFVDRRSFDMLAYPAPEKLDVLISINNNVAAGLRGDAG